MSQKIYAHDGAEFLSLFFPSKLYYFHMFGLWNQDLFNNRYSSKHTQLFAEMYLFNCKFVMPYFFEMAFLKDEPRQKHVSLNSKSINKLLFLLVLCLSSYVSFWENLTGDVGSEVCKQSNSRSNLPASGIIDGCECIETSHWSEVTLN